MRKFITLTSLIGLLALGSCNTKNDEVFYDLEGAFESDLQFKLGFMTLKCPLLDTRGEARLTAEFEDDGNIDRKSVEARLRQMGALLMRDSIEIKDNKMEVLSRKYQYIKSVTKFDFVQVGGNYNRFRIGSGSGDCKIEGGLPMKATMTCVVPMNNAPMVSASTLEAEGVAIQSIRYVNTSGDKKRGKLINGCYLNMKSDTDGFGDAPVGFSLKTKGFLKLNDNYDVRQPTPIPVPTVAPPTPAPVPTVAPPTPAPVPTVAPPTPAPVPTVVPPTPMPQPTVVPPTPQVDSPAKIQAACAEAFAYDSSKRNECIEVGKRVGVIKACSEAFAYDGKKRLSCVEMNRNKPLIEGCAKAFSYDGSKRLACIDEFESPRLLQACSDAFAYDASKRFTCSGSDATQAQVRSCADTFPYDASKRLDCVLD